MATAFASPPAHLAGFSLRVSSRRRRVAVPRAASSDDAREGGEASKPKSKLDPDNFVEVALSPEDLVRAQYKEDTAQSLGDSILGGQNLVQGTSEETRGLVPFGADNLAVLRYTKKYAEAFEAGVDPSGVVAEALGVASLVELSEAQRAYAAKVRDKLEENAQRMRGYTLEASRLYKQGVFAYSKGLYPDSVEWMKAALEETDPVSKLGGEIQIQMAMGYYAYGKVDEAIEVFEELIARHPERNVKKAAEELKYIYEAPKMDIGDDEKVEVPLLKDDYYGGGRYRSYGGGGSSTGGSARPEKSLDELYGDDYEFPIRLPQNPFITVAGLSVALGIAAYSATLAR